jgi:hypothetical protein
VGRYFRDGANAQEAIMASDEQQIANAYLLVVRNVAVVGVHAAWIIAVADVPGVLPVAVESDN